eukprot:5829159-Pyramimonas_sp.AAC.1
MDARAMARPGSAPLGLRFALAARAGKRGGEGGGIRRRTRNRGGENDDEGEGGGGGSGTSGEE